MMPGFDDSLLRESGPGVNKTIARLVVRLSSFFRIRVYVRSDDLSG